MGILPDVAQHGCAVDGYEVVAPNGRTTTAPITAEHGALVVPRLTLDEIILQPRDRAAARDSRRSVTVSHVEPRRAAPASHAEDGRTFEARVAIIATGAAFGVLTPQPASCSARRRAMLAARAYFEDLQRDVAQQLPAALRRRAVAGLRLGLSRSSRRAANIGVGFLPQPALRHGRRRPSSASSRRPDRAKPCSTARARPGRSRAIRSASIFSSAPTFAEHTLLVGEAAGLVNPLTGEGIDYALESGMIAAEHRGPRPRPRAYTMHGSPTTIGCFALASKRSSASASGSATGTASRRC